MRGAIATTNRSRIRFDAYRPPDLMEKLTLMGEHYVCEVHLSSHTLDLSWECSSHWSGRVEGVLSLRKLAWPRASLVPPSRTIVSLFSFRHTTSPCHLPRCPRIAPRKETASLRAPFSPVVPTAIPSSDSAPARARPAPQIQNPLRAAVSAASPAPQTSFHRAPPPPRLPPAPLAKPSPLPLPAAWSPLPTPQLGRVAFRLI